MSAPQLARRIGVQENTLEAWERDRDQPRGNRLSMVAGVLNVSLPWLLHGIGKGPATEKRTEFVPQLSQQLDQLKRLHRQTADLIGRLERDITRAAS
ncbi:helix-turn-helix transcriptional regulator [Aquamicrobium sp. cd-1]|uniref:Helix-turn-helix transcriptional regulator n=2 Tax=Aquamicrobium zhengzhouense TaxID=2781738 RepID=A0ABS0S9A7_9HYPH|nr:helix-turn-helix transcriptional regulator [Aquamicrobium zhengzhouense]